ncbi:MAG: DEAD/DEAH box helicase [Bacillota bacterium]|nr:DEAD/DEAH box helicase [Bacillota bacterium]
MDLKKYSNLNISEETFKAIENMGFTDMTEIQQKAIPEMLLGKDIIAKSPTGTGKTVAYGLPIIENINSSASTLQSLILCPTRELCIQINEQFRLLSKFKKGIKTIAVYGGQPISNQIIALKKGPQIIVATPGRLIDHIKRKNICLDHIKTAVLDEADEMLDMGFVKDVCSIMDKLPKEKQVVMFSATISREIMDISWLYQRDPIELTVLPENINEPKITQYSVECGRSNKTEILKNIIKQNQYKRVIVFCNTKRMTNRLMKELNINGLQAECLHGDIKQFIRSKIMAKFKAGNTPILIATDVAARGIDVEDVDAVFNYDVPQDNAYYLHRIGRTGRAQKEGTSYIFYTYPEKFKVDEISALTHSKIIPLYYKGGDLKTF